MILQLMELPQTPMKKRFPFKYFYRCGKSWKTVWYGIEQCSYRESLFMITIITYNVHHDAREKDIPVSPACNCIFWMQGVTPSKTYIRLLLLGQNLNWNVHSLPFMSWILMGIPSDWLIAGKYACPTFYFDHKTQIKTKRPQLSNSST